MGIKNFATKIFSWVREGLASWDLVCRFLRSLNETDDLDFYQGLDERAIRFDETILDSKVTVHQRAVGLRVPSH